jgi:protein-S-isoprenylcysteine O-methyltransferase Ste14
MVDPAPLRPRRRPDRLARARRHGAGASPYLWCIWVFAAAEGGTPGPWDAPRSVIAVGPYRWVHNPIYLPALLVALGEAWLFLSRPLLVHAAVRAIFFHLFVIGHKEQTLRRRFGDDAYVEHLRTVPPLDPTPTPPWLNRRPVRDPLVKQAV